MMRKILLVVAAVVTLLVATSTPALADGFNDFECPPPPPGYTLDC